MPVFTEMFSETEYTLAREARAAGDTHPLFQAFPCPDFAARFDRNDKPLLSKDKAPYVSLALLVEAERRLAHLAPPPLPKGRRQTPEHVEHSARVRRLLEQLTYQALYDPNAVFDVTYRGGRRQMRQVLGGRWGVVPATAAQLSYQGGTTAGLLPAVGPVDRHRVMVVGKMPGQDEMQHATNLIGASGRKLRDLIEKTGVDPENWYVSNVVRWPSPDPKSDDRWPSDWVKTSSPLLRYEIELVRPEIILTVGGEALKAVTQTNASMEGTKFRILDYTDGDHTAKLISTIHPAFVIRRPDKEPDLLKSLHGVSQLVASGKAWEKETDYLHLEVRTLEQLDKLADAILATPGSECIAFDCEWHGLFPGEPGAYLRSVQFSWAHKQAAAIVLHDAGGVPVLWEQRAEVVRIMSRFAKSTSDRTVRAIGHNFNADLPWLLHLGLDLLPEFLPVVLQTDPADPATLTGAELTKDLGGFDTILAAHAYRETDDFKLELLCVSKLGLHRYDTALQEWKKGHLNRHKIKDKDLSGYGECPGDVLIGIREQEFDFGISVRDSYGCFDADGTRRLFVLYNGEPGRPGLLDRDEMGNNCRVPFWRAMAATLAFGEFHRVGVGVDLKRAAMLSELYVHATAALVAHLRESAGWPEFNPSSVHHCRELLFGTELNGRKDKAGRPIRISPPDARLALVEPYISTGKRPKLWADIHEEDRPNYSPSTNKEVLMVLADQHPLIKLLRGIRVLGQVTRFVMRPPERVDHPSPAFAESTDPPIPTSVDAIVPDDPEEAGDDEFEFKKGMMSFVLKSDGRVHGQFAQTKETGRASSFAPPMQNMCFDPGTEYLTTRGWVFVADLRPDDKVAQYVPDTEEIEFVSPSHIHVSRYDGDLVRIRMKKHVDLLVTPNHRCLVRGRKSGVLHELPAAEFRGDWHHLHAGFYRQGQVDLPADEVTWLCAVQADGSFVDGGGIIFNFTKERKRTKLRATLDRLGVTYSVYDNEAIYVGIKANRERVIETTELLGSDKVMGSWLLDFNQSTLDRFADEITFWDGNYRRKESCYSTQKQTADWYQIVWALTGHRARMRTYHNGNPNAKLLYSVDRPVRDRVGYTCVAKAVRTLVPYTGLVYCVTVPSGWLMVRRNGVVSVSGNSKSAESVYEKLYKEYGPVIGRKYMFPLRSVVRARPGHKLVDADWTGAELAVAAVQSGDVNMIEHVKRAQLDETHPDFYDIHSNVAVTAFKLDCPPTKKGLKDIGKGSIRTAAKACVFGTMYGQQAGSLARKARQEGTEITEYEAQALIDGLFQLYPSLLVYFDECRRRSHNPRWLANCYGRYRRFEPTDDKKTAGEFERQAMNFPVQCLSECQFVLTATGYRRIGTVVGGGVTVPGVMGTGTGICVRSGEKEVWETKTERGTVLKTSGEHVFFVYDPVTGGLAEKMVSELTVDDYVVRCHVPAGTAEVSRCSSPEEAYLVGAIFGDGGWYSNGERAIRATDVDVIARVTSSIRSVFGVDPYIRTMEKRKETDSQVSLISLPHDCDMPTRLGFGSYAQTERDLPDWVLTDPYRLQVLDGLLDTDGGCGVHDDGANVNYTSVSRKLVEKVYLMLSSEGVASTFSGPYSNGKYSEFYRLTVTGENLTRLMSLVKPANVSRYEKAVTSSRGHKPYPPSLVKRAAVAAISAGVSQLLAPNDRAVLYRMRATGYASVDNLIRFVELAGLNSNDFMLHLRFDRIEFVRPTGKTEQMADICVTDGHPSFGLAGVLVHNSTVADAMNMALHHLYWYRFEYGRPDTHWYDLVLQVHDAVVLEVPDHCIDWVVDEVLPACMSKRVPMYSCKLDGTRNMKFPDPFHLQAPPPDVFNTWSIGLGGRDCLASGISTRYALRCDRCLGGVTSNSFLTFPAGICDKCVKAEAAQKGGLVC